MSGRWELGSVLVLRHAGFPFEMVERLGWSDDLRAAIDAVLDAPDDAGARQALDRRLAEELPELRRRLREAAADPLVQEAVFLSNPAVHEHNWRRYLAAGDDRPNADHRRLERLVYTYLQRLCGKNETASFFGPMGYGEVDGDGWARVELLPAGRRRRVLLAHWAAEQLARAIDEDPELAAHVPLHLTQVFRLEGGRLRRRGPAGRTVALAPEAARLLIAIEGGAGSLAAAAADGDVAAAEAALRPLVAAGVVRRGLVVDGEDVDLLAQLTRAVAALPAGPAGTWRARLDELSRLVRAFEAAGLAGRRRLLPEIERLFTEWTGVAARRGEGRIYADRLVLFEEAASPFRLHVGRRLVRWLEDALAGALDLSAAYGETVQAGYRGRLAGRLAGSAPLSLLDYVAALPPEELRPRQAPPPVGVGAPANGAIAAAVDPRLCGRPSAGARYALLDVCLGAAALEPAGGGAPLLVLARVHHQLLLWSWLTIFHPDRERVESSALGWLARRRDGLAGLVTRRHNKSFYSYPGRRVSLDTAMPAAAGALAAGEVRVVAGGDGPELRDADGRALRLYLPLADHSTTPALAAFADPLVLHAPLTGEGAALPRLVVGEAVYQRRRWRTPAAGLRGRRDADLLVEVARLRRRHGWPRFVYVRMEDERKPYLIDLECPFACELLKHLAGRAAALTVEEMLPGPDQLWLRDERGRYTCELRWQVSRNEGDEG